MTIHDFIIVGGGSAGCVLASRLSEDPNRSVLLLEAGPDYGADMDRWPADIVNANTRVKSHDWGYQSASSIGITPIHLARGKILGGSSATNSVVALRGHPSDYDAWAGAGNIGWSFQDVLPFFKMLEHDLDESGESHGKNGPISIRRHSPMERSPIHRAFLETARSVGHSLIEDHNFPGAVGVGRLPENAVGDVRQSTAFTYLMAARDRTNLSICADEMVDRVEFENRRAVAVRLRNTGRTIQGRQIILAAGVYGSPSILLRSGVGPAQQLEELGLQVACDLPGVGSNLQDHPLIRLRYATADEPAPPGVSIRHTMLTAKTTERLAPDLHIFPSGPIEQGDGAIVHIVIALMRPLSTGRIFIDSIDPGVPPRIELNLFGDPGDFPRLFEGLLLARQIAKTRPFSDCLLTEQWPGEHVRSEADLTAAIRRTPEMLSTYQHGTGTCRMGAPTDRDAVTGPFGAVHGLDRLYVIDASIMPSIPSANTNIPTIMLAERIAAAAKWHTS